MYTARDTAGVRQAGTKERTRHLRVVVGECDQKNARDRRFHMMITSDLAKQRHQLKGKVRTQGLLRFP